MHLREKTLLALNAPLRTEGRTPPSFATTSEPVASTNYVNVSLDLKPYAANEDESAFWGADLIKSL